MGKLHWIVLIWGWLCWPAMATDIIPGDPQQQPIALVGGTVHSVSGESIANGVVVFDNGIITAVGDRGVEIPAAAHTIDVTGKEVYPGLIAPNTTLGLVEVSAVRASRDLSETGDVNPNAKAALAYNPDSEVTPTVRSNGVLTALIVPQGGLISGTSALVMLDGWSIDDAALAKELAVHLHWPRMRILRGWWVKEKEQQQQKKIDDQLRRIEEVFDKARQYSVAKKAGLKNHKIDARWEAMVPVLDKSRPLFVHANSSLQIEAAIYFCRRQGVDMVLVGGADCWRLLPLLKKHDIPVVVNRVHSLPRREDEDYDLPFRLPAILHRAGIRFCLSHGGFWDVRNLPFDAGTAVAFGLPKEVALAAVTLQTAQILGVDGRIGSIEVGKDATLVVSSGDILDTRTNHVEYAFIQGRKIDLDNRHKRLYRKYRAKYGK